MKDDKLIKRTRILANFFLLSVIVVCFESIAGMHNAADVALAAIVATLAVFMLTCIGVSIVIEKWNKNTRTKGE